MINQNPFLSIITVNYNNAEGLKKTMQSVLDLEFQDYEYIIIDGGSTDDSKNIIEYFVNSTNLGKKISYWCSERDEGIYNAMNKGISHSKGNVISLMNSGDSFVSDALNNIENLIEDNPESILYGAVNQVRKGEYVNTYAHNPKYSIENGLCSQAALIPMKLHDLIGFYNEKYKICADFDFYQRAISSGYTLKFINRIVCNFDIGGVSTTQNKNRLLEMKEIKANYCLGKKSSFMENIKIAIKYFLPYGLIKIYTNYKK